MNIDFVGADKNFIKSEIQSGFYHDEAELVRDAVRRLREEKEHLQYFQKAVIQGMNDIEHGKVTTFTPDLLQEIKKEAIQKAQNNEPYSSTDALPKNS